MEHYQNRAGFPLNRPKGSKDAKLQEMKPLDLHGILSIIRRHRRIVYYTTCLAIIVAVLFNLTPPTYEAKVVLRVVPTSKGLTDIAMATWSSDELAKQKTFTYATLFKSRSVVNAMLDKVNVGRKDALSYEKIIDRITVRTEKDSEILNIFVSAGSPEEAQMLVNALALAFNERLIDIVRAESKESRIFIGERLSEAKRELDKAEKALVDYRSSNRVVAISEQARAFVDRQATIKKMENENWLALEAARAKMRNYRVIADTAAIAQYRVRLMEAETELAGVLKNYTDQHPRVKSLKASVADNQNMIKEELARIAQSELTLSEAQLGAIQRINSQIDLESAQLPVTETKVARLVLDYNVAEGLYTMLAKRYEESRIGEMKESANVQIIDMAYLPGAPVKPRKYLNLSIAAFMGLVVGTLLTFVVEYFFKTIDSAEEVRQCLNLRVIGSIPRVRKKSKWMFWKNL